MQFPEHGQHVRAEGQDARVARVEPCGRFRPRLQPGDRRAGGGQGSLGIGLGVEQVGPARGFRPVAPSGVAEAQAPGGTTFAVGGGIAVGGPDLEQAGIAHPPGHVGRGGAQQRRQDGGPHRVEFRRDRVGKLQGFIPAAEGAGQFSAHERKRHGLVQAARRQGRAHAGGLHDGRAGRAPGQHARAFHGCLGDGVKAVDPQDLLDQVGLAVDVGTPDRRRDLPDRSGILNAEAEATEDRGLVFRGDLHAAKRRHPAGAERNRRGRGRHGAGLDDLASFAAAQLEDQPRGLVDAPVGGRRIHAALEAVAGVREDSQPAPRPGGADRIEQRDLQEDVARCFRAPCLLAPHDPADGAHPVVVSDHRDVRVQRVRVPVERRERLARTGHPHRQGSGHLVGVKHVERPAAVDRDVVRDVDQRGNRAETDRSEAALHPVRTGAVGHVAEVPPGDQGAGLPALAEGARPGDGACVRSRHGRERRLAQCPDTGRGQVARDAAHARAVAAVGGERDFEDGIVGAGPRRVRGPDRGVLGQFDDPVVIFAQSELVGGAQHALPGHAADLLFRQRDPATRNVRPDGCEHGLHAGAGVGRAAHHRQRGAAGVHGADAEAVRIGMRTGFHDPADHERSQLLAAILHRLDFQADCGQTVGDVRHAGVGVEVLPKPGQRELHGSSPSSRLGRASMSKP